MTPATSFLWTEKYRPKKVEEVILPDRLKQTFQQFVASGNLPNLVLAGPAGCGKTSIAVAALMQLGCQYLMINGSMEGDINTLRTKIKEFASTMSFTGGRKYVIIDEADYLTANTQAALRNFMEEFEKNCGFILTCNYKHRIIPELFSRASSVDFIFTKEESKKMLVEMFKNVQNILKLELVEFNQKAVAEVLKKYFPDFRKVVNELQWYSASGKIDQGILVEFDSAQFTKLVKLLKEKKLSEIRQWVIDNPYEDQLLFRTLYDSLNTIVTPASIPPIILIIAKYQYQSAFVADKEINLVAALIEIMIEAEFQ